MNNILEYKGYLTKIEFNSVDKVLYGKIEGISDLIIFENEDASKIEEEFHRAVDDYLSFCEEVGKEPDKIYKGTFNIRISPQLHKELALRAFRNNESLNQTVENAISGYLKSSTNIVSELCAALSNWTSISDEVYYKSLTMWKKATENNIKQNRCLMPDFTIQHINRYEKEDFNFVGIR